MRLVDSPTRADQQGMDAVPVRVRTAALAVLAGLVCALSAVGVVAAHGTHARPIEWSTVPIRWTSHDLAYATKVGRICRVNICASYVPGMRPADALMHQMYELGLSTTNYVAPDGRTSPHS